MGKFVAPSFSLEASGKEREIGVSVRVRRYAHLISEKGEPEGDGAGLAVGQRHAAKRSSRNGKLVSVCC